MSHARRPRWRSSPAQLGGVVGSTRLGALHRLGEPPRVSNLLVDQGAEGAQVGDAPDARGKRPSPPLATPTSTSRRAFSASAPRPQPDGISARFVRSKGSSSASPRSRREFRLRLLAVRERLDQPSLNRRQTAQRGQRLSGGAPGSCSPRRTAGPGRRALGPAVLPEVLVGPRADGQGHGFEAAVAALGEVTQRLVEEGERVARPVPLLGNRGALRGRAHCRAPQRALLRDGSCPHQRRLGLVEPAAPDSVPARSMRPSAATPCRPAAIARSTNVRTATSLSANAPRPTSALARVKPARISGREAGLLSDLHRLVRRRRRLLEAAGRIEHGRALQQRLGASFFARRRVYQPACLVERLGRPSHVAGVAEDRAEPKESRRELASNRDGPLVAAAGGGEIAGGLLGAAEVHQCAGVRGPRLRQRCVGLGGAVEIAQHHGADRVEPQAVLLRQPRLIGDEPADPNDAPARRSPRRGPTALPPGVNAPARRWDVTVWLLPVPCVR